MFVPRPHLCDLLRREQRRLQLLCAPAGYGKTVLLRRYVQDLPSSTRVVWLDLEGQAPSLLELIRILAGELGLAAETSPEALLVYLAATGRAVQATDDDHIRLRLVFDDLPGVMPADLNRWFDQLLCLHNPHLQLLVSCRQRPDWNLPQLMLTGELLELDARQLALRPDEFDALVALIAPESDTAWRENLWHQTGGWCAGVRLLPASLLGAYLERELLQRLGDEQREMLYGLAHLSKASAELCEQLWEGQQGAHVFGGLVAAQAFLFPIDNQPGWFRLLPAVAQALQPHLSGAPLLRLRLRACQRLNVLGQVDDAVEQALSADRPEVAASYMERLWLSWILAERHLGRFMDWRERIEPQLLQSSPRLIYLCAKALVFSGRLEEAEDCLQRLGQFLPLPEPQRNRRLLANWQALYGTLQAIRGNLDPAREHCLDSLPALTAQDWLSVLLCHCTLARIAMQRGELQEAHRLLEQSLELARRQGSRDAEVLVNTDRVRLLLLQGRLSLAQAVLRNECAYLKGANTQPNPLLGRLLFMHGELLLLQGRGDEAEQVLQNGLLQVRDVCAPFVLAAYLLLSECAARKGEADKAQLLLYDGERRMQWAKIDTACFQGPIAAQQARNQAFAQGKAADAAPPAQAAGVADYQDDLTPREVSVLKLLAEGMSVREVGHRLFISENTVKSHAKNINVKLGACRRTQAINSAKAMGILA
ncbi:ATP-dependent transcriptional regulator [Pseudomonas alkylphenolica]|uniref:ATP-dependent transcriptional regulator n=1 Tax=Pseudomonas alkylphenolica TaxID=237609 RepID=A0A443ZEP2_9PSED|nr:LuxR C-terminal-related transcriptional regulator [Pseudomonas alkylphenolica]RWU17168.1 ATP-dependent transcriptional regulator [Pseudomonas alkylphenolica]